MLVLEHDRYTSTIHPCQRLGHEGSELPPPPPFPMYMSKTTFPKLARARNFRRKKRRLGITCQGRFGYEQPYASRMTIECLSPHLTASQSENRIRIVLQSGQVHLQSCQCLCLDEVFQIGRHPHILGKGGQLAGRAKILKIGCN